ncbi:hypothetical protein [Kingella sp. (in: b-proteobacteria)]|uniref:hypothetical protein n=1 Tax=Kingella sp. (in: b-proteobacteria) TaxID=2020713 RepID=UPI0026DB9752|nr:hypothetical protein [Kingella sp. (in: b-proteobacteria)]MDO4656428.1 hypothetical protein [Kingella sp. (in: b-proteobacteria)]
MAVAQHYPLAKSVFRLPNPINLGSLKNHSAKPNPHYHPHAFQAAPTHKAA